MLPSSATIRTYGYDLCPTVFAHCARLRRNQDCPGTPRMSIDPLSACSVKSLAGRPAHGPVRPQGEIETKHQVREAAHDGARIDPRRGGSFDDDVGIEKRCSSAAAPGSRMTDFFEK